MHFIQFKFTLLHTSYRFHRINTKCHNRQTQW